MLFERKALVVDAIQLRLPTVINGQSGKPGDYFVTFGDGSLSVMDKDAFEGIFTPVSEPVQAPDLSEPLATTAYVCLGCGDEVDEAHFERTSGMCVACLKKPCDCHTCGRECYQYEIIGTLCRHCLKK